MPPLPPELPPLPPSMPRGKLWLPLLAPPVFGAAAILTLVCCKPANGMLSQNLLLAWLFVGIASFVGFVMLLAKRRFVSHVTVMLIFGYLIGQAVLGVALLFGSCVLAL